jgi:hypothetical protein
MCCVATEKIALCFFVILLSLGLGIGVFLLLLIPQSFLRSCPLPGGCPTFVHLARLPAIVGHRNLMLLRLTCPSSEKKIDFRKSANEDTVQCTGNITEQDNN